MASDWRHELKYHPKVRERNRRLSFRKRELGKDEQFVLLTERLRSRFENALTKHGSILVHFLRKYGYPAGPCLAEALEFLNNDVKNTSLKALLRGYLTYAARFGVRFRLAGKRPHFHLEYLVPWGSKFHVKLVREQFEPVGAYPGDDEQFEDYFEADRMTLPASLEKLIASSKGKFALIEDVSWSSALSRLEYFASFPEGLTFVVHDAERPYLLCLIGEKVTDDDWKKASPARSALLRKYFNRGKAGRRRNIRRLREAIKLRKRPGPLKNKVVPHGDEAKFFDSGYAYLSRLGKELR